MRLITHGRKETTETIQKIGGREETWGGKRFNRVSCSTGTEQQRSNHFEHIRMECSTAFHFSFFFFSLGKFCPLFFHPVKKITAILFLFLLNRLFETFIAAIVSTRQLTCHPTSQLSHFARRLLSVDWNTSSSSAAALDCFV